MPLLINRISNLTVRRVVNIARFFSSPCFILSSRRVGESLEDIQIVNHSVFDPTTEKVVTYNCYKKLPKKLFGQTLLGASQGWVASVKCEHLPVNLTDMYKPRVSSPRVIPLPSLGFYPPPYSTELSLSSSFPDQDQHFTVAAKFCGTHLSVCKPCWDTKWTHIETSLPLFPCSELMFSKRDKAFHFTSVKGLYMGSLHLSNNNNNKKLKYQQLRLRNLPKIPLAGQEMLDKCFMSKHLVESPSGELFLVNWYSQCIHAEEKYGQVEGIESKTKRFMVFKEDEISKDFCYTEDIGGLCIFLGEGEAFCLTASMYPGLKPNSIYYIGHGLGSYDITSGTVHSFDLPCAPMFIYAPFWIPSHL